MVFSPQACLEVGLRGGRILYYACPPSAAIHLAAFLSCYETASQWCEDWRDSWGSKRKYVVTLRDYINAGSAIAKLSLSKKYEENKTEEKEREKARLEANKKASEAEKKRYLDEKEKQIAENKQSLQLTEKDLFYLAVLGLTVETAIAAGGAVLKGIEKYYEYKHRIKEMDKAVTYGLLFAIGGGIITSFLVYKYMEKFNNKRRQNKYGCIWTADGDVTCCTLCGMNFKTFTLRKSLRRHHCRMCGRIVCHACGSKTLYLPTSRKQERVCRSCVIANRPPEVHSFVSLQFR